MAKKEKIMKNKLIKALGTVAAACAVLAMGAAFVACGNNTDEKKPEPKPKTTISWQATGCYDELRAVFSSFDFMGNLMSDGTGTIYRYEKSDELIETPIKWKVETDRDGLTMLTLDDKIEDPFEAYLDEDTNTFEIQYRFAFSGSYHREVMLTISNTVKYDSTEKFKAAADERRSKLDDEEKPGDTKTAVVTMTGSQDGQKLEFYADNTAKLFINANYGFDYTWGIDNGAVKIKSVANAAEEPIVSTESNGKISMSYSATMGGNTINIVFTCDDISALTATATKTAVVTFNGDNGNKIEFYADNTAKILAYGGSINFDYTWAVADGVITMTSVNNPNETINSTSEGGVVTIVYAANMGGHAINLTFTCNDISALTA